MKLIAHILFFLIASLCTTSPACAAATLLAFDNLATPEVLPGLNYTFIANGYGNLLWNNFCVLNGTIRPVTEGYHAGVVSTNNVAFNFQGEPASISSGVSLFNLNSAYLTAALNLDTPLNVQVQGFAGSTLLYSNTYTVSRSGPSLIDFDYIGVDQVRFRSAPAQQFAMDNLTVTVPEPSAIGLLLLTACGVGIGGFRKRYGSH